MIKTYKVELIPDNEITALVDLELNELRLNAIISEVEQEILALRIRKATIIKHKAETEKAKIEERSQLASAPQKSWFQARRESISRYLRTLGKAIIGG